MTETNRSDDRHPRTPLSVAVTGGIGAGKSTVSAALAARGAVVIDADRLAREVVEPGTPGLAAVTAEFGAGVITADGALDRPALGEIVFSDAAARARLERITHPLVRELFDRRLATVPADGIVVNDIPLIRTLGDAARYHLVIGVGIAEVETRVHRLVARGHTEADARARIAAQISDDERRRLADVWIDNSGDTADLEPALDGLWDRLTTFATNRRAGAVSGAAGGAKGDPVGGAPGVAASGAPGAGTDQDRAVLIAARVSRACGDRVPEIGPGPLTMTVALDSPSAVETALPRLQDAGFPAVGAGAASHRLGSADPAVSLDLYLTVNVER